MPTQFQKLLDFTSANINSVFVNIDDILILTKGTKQQHMNKVREVLKVQGDANLQLKAEICVVAQECIEWMGYKLTRTVFPGQRKIPGKKRETTTDEFKAITLMRGSRKSV